LEEIGVTAVAFTNTASGYMGSNLSRNYFLFKTVNPLE
jgi:hypothetical protein